MAAGPLQGPNGAEAQLQHALALGPLSQEALAQMLGARPVFVSAGCYEPFGLSVLEAAGAGCALVLADIPTLRELWDGAALFVPVDDPQAIAQATDALIGDPARRLGLGQAATSRAARFTPERTAFALAAIHASLASDRRRQAA